MTYLALNETHDPARRSWIESANERDCDFPIQNLPFGVFSRKGADLPHIGVAIGDYVLDLTLIQQAGYLDDIPDVFQTAGLNAFMALGQQVWSKTRAELARLLDATQSDLRDDTALLEKIIVAQQDVIMHRPFQPSGFTDFYASKEHASNVGTMFRGPDNALMPNWLHMPIGYNGRASSVVVSGCDIHRPVGQMKTPYLDKPIFAASTKLDFELEMGAIIGQNSQMGLPISVNDADAMIFGYVLLNDWSARDLQVWEYQPLGPFLSKAFATSISPWIVTQEALMPFRVEGPIQDPSPLPYLRQQDRTNFDIDLAVHIALGNSPERHLISRSNFKYIYWSVAQQLAHHTVSGCPMEIGDLLGSGTISGTDQGSYGSMLELSWNGQNPLKLGEATRSFLEDGDRVTMTGQCENGPYRLGFGEVTGKILAQR